MVLQGVLDGLTGRKVPKSGDPLADTLMVRLIDDGIGGFLGKFTAAGLGTAANSWVGTGPNTQLKPEDVQSALGAATVDDIAHDAEVSRYEANHGLAAMIPNVIDKLSPRGSLPTGNLTKSLKGFDLASILAE